MPWPSLHVTLPHTFQEKATLPAAFSSCWPGRKSQPTYPLLPVFLSLPSFHPSILHLTAPVRLAVHTPPHRLTLRRATAACLPRTLPHARALLPASLRLPDKDRK